MNALQALLVTLLIEAPIVALAFPGRRRRACLIATFATASTNLALNLLVLRCAFFGANALFIGELFAVAIEASAYALLIRPPDWGRAIAVSAAANALSFGLGPLLLRTIT